MKTRIVVTAVIKKGNLLLFGRKPVGVEPYPNTLHLLGGGIKQESESTEEDLRREIREEAGIEVRNLHKIGFDEDYEPDKHGETTHYLFLQYETDYERGEPKAGDDITALEWHDKRELPTLALNRPSKKMFKKMGWL
ncbi:TPA: NUDIX domain-containing protein [Candidatus Micrarchaeota archaeon]|nr:NUDIX domain-containing protein [Candidatus Micrarchaeota archaeon]